MAEVIGLVGSITGILQVTVEALAVFKDYISSVKVATESARRLEQEITALNQALSDLAKSTNRGVNFTPAVHNALKECGVTLENMLEEFRLARQQETTGLRGLAKKLKWPSREKKILAWITVLERYKSLFVLQLQTVTAIGMKEVDSGVKNIQDNQRVKAHEGKRNKLMHWLSSLPYNVKHEKTSSSRQPNTGDWLFQKPTYQKWETVNGDTNAVWLSGLPGSGKSFLASNVIDRLLKAKSNGDDVVAYCYCDFSNYAATAPQNIIRTLLVQMLVSWQVDSQERFEDLFRMMNSGQGPPSNLSILVELTQRCLRLSPGSNYIVIDALDECIERELLLDYLVELMQKNDQVRIFVTARQEQDIIDRLTPAFATISLANEGENLQKDMQHHLLQELSGKKWLHVQENIKTQLIDTLLKDSERSMFRWLQCQLEVLSKTKTNNGLKQALKDLPRDLFRVYERILEGIDEESKELVQKALLWLAISHEPMRLSQLVEALTIVSGESKLDHDATVNSELDLVRICGSLVKYDPDTKYIFLSHLTVKEFLLSDKLKAHPTLANYGINFKEASSTLAKLTLTYLLLEDFENGACATPHAFQERIAQYPLYIYCIQTFHIYINAGEDDGVFDLLWTLFDKRIPQYRSFQQAYHLLALRIWDILQQHWKLMLTLQPMHYVVALNLRWVAKRLIQQHPELLEEEISTRGPPLFMATRDNLTEMVKLFLTFGANFEYGAEKPNERTPLLVAANNGNETIFRILLDAGADLNIRGRGDMHAIHEVAANSSSLLSLILNKGVNPNIRCGGGSTPLHYAISGGCMESIKILVAAGANIFARSNVGQTPLHLALSLHLVPVLDFLLESIDDFSPLQDPQETLIVSDIAWAKSRKWYSKLYDGIAKASNTRSQNSVEISGVELSKLRLGFTKTSKLPPGVVEDIFDLSSLWVKKTVSKNERVKITQTSPRVPYISVPIHRPLRRVVISTRSHDQGFSDNKDAQGTYRGSWTWFELSINTQRDPVPSILSAPKELHCNVHASLTFRDHRSVLDFHDPTKGVRQLLESVKPGDKLEVFPMAKFPGWVNVVDRMDVEVFFA